MRVGQAGAQRALEQSLAPPPADFDVVGKTENALDQDVVDQRHADLQRVRHGEPVAQGQDVVRQEGLVVQVQTRSESSGRPAAVVQLLEVIHRGRALDVLIDSRAKEGVPIAVVDAPEEREKALRGPVSSRAEESLEPIDAERPPARLTQSIGESTGDALDAEWQAPIVLAQQGADVATVAGEQLVATDSRERDFVRRSD